VSVCFFPHFSFFPLRGCSGWSPAPHTKPTFPCLHPVAVRGFDNWFVALFSLAFHKFSPLLVLNLFTPWPVRPFDSGTGLVPGFRSTFSFPPFFFFMSAVSLITRLIVTSTGPLPAPPGSFWLFLRVVFLHFYFPPPRSSALPLSRGSHMTPRLDLTGGGASIIATPPHDVLLEVQITIVSFSLLHDSANPLFRFFFCSARLHFLLTCR